jgi:hypothetical protein
MKAGDFVIVNSRKLKDVKARVFSTDFGDVLLCITEDGKTFSAHIANVVKSTPWERKQAIVEAPPPPPLVAVVAAPKQSYNTIKPKAAKPQQHKLF